MYFPSFKISFCLLSLTQLQITCTQWTLHVLIIIIVTHVGSNQRHTNVYILWYNQSYFLYHKPNRGQHVRFIYYVFLQKFSKQCGYFVRENLMWLQITVVKQINCQPQRLMSSVLHSTQLSPQHSLLKAHFITNNYRSSHSLFNWYLSWYLGFFLKQDSLLVFLGKTQEV